MDCWSKIVDIAQLVTAVAAVAAVVVVVIGWSKSLDQQRKSNRDAARLGAMKSYQSQLQERYENMLILLAPFISSMQVFSSLINISEDITNAQLKLFFEGLHKDASKMEEGIVPYYLTLQANTFFNNDAVQRHAQRIESLSSQIREILGHPHIPRSKGVTIQTFVTLNQLQNEFVEEAYMFMRALNQDIKNEIDSYEK